MTEGGQNMIELEDRQSKSVAQRMVDEFLNDWPEAIGLPAHLLASPARSIPLDELTAQRILKVARR